MIPSVMSKESPDMSTPYSIDPTTPVGQRIVRLAAVGLALNPDDLKRELGHHKPSADGAVCVGCGEPWRCLPGGIAWYARRFIDLARQAGVAAEPPPSSIGAGVWDEFFGPDPDDGTVPPVLGADDENAGGC